MPTKPKPRGFTLTKVVLLAVVLLALSAGAYFAFGRAATGTSHTASEVATASNTSFDVILTANGELAAKKQTELRNALEMESTIGEIVDEGKSVKKDDVLVRINDEELQKQKDAEELELTGATSEAVSAQKGYEIQEIDNDAELNKAKVTLELAQLELKKWNGENAAKIQELGLDLKASEKDHERATDKYEKAVTLHDRQFLSTDQLKQDEVMQIQAESKLQTARTSLEVHKAFTQVKELRKLETDISDAVAQLERTTRKNESELSSKRAALDKAVAEKAQRERQLSKIKRQIENTVIKAPTDGLVVYNTSLQPSWWGNNQGPMAIGRKVYPNETIIVLPDTTEMLAKIKVHESMVNRIKPGLKAAVRIDAAQGKTFEGVVESVGIMAQQGGGWGGDNVREYEVKIALTIPAGSPPLKPSMRCEAQVTTEKVENVLAIPLTSVFNEGPRTIVYAVKGGKYQRLPVKVGRRSDLMAEITTGLTVGEQVLLREPSPALVLADPKDDLKDADKNDAKPGEAALPVVAATAAPTEAKPAVKTDEAKAVTAKPEADAETEKPAEDDAEKEETEAEKTTTDAPPADGQDTSEGEADPITAGTPPS